MDRRPTWTDCDAAGDYVVPNVLSPRDLVSRPDNMDETVPHTRWPVFGSYFLNQLLVFFFFILIKFVKQTNTTTSPQLLLLKWPRSATDDLS